MSTINMCVSYIEWHAYLYILCVPTNSPNPATLEEVRNWAD